MQKITAALSADQQQRVAMICLTRGQIEAMTTSAYTLGQ